MHQNSNPPAGTLVRIHQNLNKSKPGDYVWSVSTKVPSKGWRLHNHTPRITVCNCKLVIAGSGQARAIREKVRNVHAWVEGVVCPNVTETTIGYVGYNPFKSLSFYSQSVDRPIDGTDLDGCKVSFEDHSCMGFITKPELQWYMIEAPKPDLAKIHFDAAWDLILPNEGRGHLYNTLLERYRESFERIKLTHQ